MALLEKFSRKSKLTESRPSLMAAGTQQKHVKSPPLSGETNDPSYNGLFTLIIIDTYNGNKEDTSEYQTQSASFIVLCYYNIGYRENAIRFIHPSRENHHSRKYTQNANMCWFVDYNHAECHHRKQRVLVDKCSLVQSGADTCRIVPIVLHTIQVEQPRICPLCFRVLQDEIFDRYNPEIFDLEQRIENAQEQFEKETEGFSRLETYSEIAADDILLEALKDERNTESARLREKYGVWRDG